MKLRLDLALTDFRQVEVSVADDITPAALVRVIRQVASESHGKHDMVTIQRMEEIPEWEGGADGRG